MKCIENEVFPGKHQSKENPESIVKVTQVKDGLIAVRGVKGPIKSALMDSMTFMTRYERVYD